MKKFFGSVLPLFIASYIIQVVVISIVVFLAYSVVGFIGFVPSIGVWWFIGGCFLSWFMLGVAFAFNGNVFMCRRPFYADERYHKGAHLIGKGGIRLADYMHRTPEQDAIFEACGGDMLEYHLQVYPDYLTAEEVAILRKNAQ
jgi:energy-coupling factor transporter transmembrane protein EcfT